MDNRFLKFFKEICSRIIFNQYTSFNSVNRLLYSIRSILSEYEIQKDKSKFIKMLKFEELLDKKIDARDWIHNLLKNVEVIEECLNYEGK